MQNTLEAWTAATENIELARRARRRNGGLRYLAVPNQVREPNPSAWRSRPKGLSAVFELFEHGRVAFILLAAAIRVTWGVCAAACGPSCGP